MSDSAREPGAVRPGEVVGSPPARADAWVAYLGRIRTPFAVRSQCPRRGALDGPLCRIELDAPWSPALEGIETGQRLVVLYWMHLVRRDLLVQAPGDRPPAGTFALRSPHRPNPIAASAVVVERVERGALAVRGLDCVDGTPLLDLKPDWPVP